MTYRPYNGTNRTGRGVFSAVLMALCLAPSIGQADPISDLESKVNDFISHSQSLYRLNDDSLNIIWETYCGEEDPSYPESKQYATLIGQELQRKEQEQFQQLYEGELPPLKEAATELLKNEETKDRAQVVLDILKKEEKNLFKLIDGAVLRGSNHPFTQFALEYGKKQHEEMCDRYKDNSIRVCDRDFSGADGRSDLVTVSNGHLIVFEFKPDNSKAKNLGWDQVKRYLAPVVSYYQDFFEDGRNGGFKKDPADNPEDYGGKKIFELLKESKDAWSSDGKYLQAIPQVETYRVCDKKFD